MVTINSQLEKNQVMLHTSWKRKDEINPQNDY